jgi:uncharacterized protein (DUF1684 family)
MTIVEATYEQEIAQWREQAEQELRAENGWLSLIGLFWLSEGKNSFGSDPTNDIVLPEGAPAHAGVFVLANEQVTLEVAPQVELTVNGGAPFAGPLKTSATGKPDLIQFGDLTLFVHRSGARHAIRVRDRNSVYRLQFAGRRWFDVQESYRVEATFVAYEQPKPLTVVNIVGDTYETLSPGYVEFALHDRRLTLDTTGDPNEALFIHFHDQTAGKTSYPGGRFLSADAPSAGRVILDFNKAVSPPCAFTSFATCPTVQPQNRLDVAIEAGERW